MQTKSKNLAWWIHFGVLAAMAAVLVVASWNVWFPPPEKTWNLEALGVAIMTCVLLFYALVTTLIMLWAARFRWSPLIIHGSAITLYGLLLYAKQQDRQEREARYQAEHADEIRRDKRR